ncbi:MAG: STT3 domain-containing protein [Candidatus Woesearchaeota archaeon]
MADNERDDDVVIDFSKIKTFFSKDKAKNKANSHDHAEKRDAENIHEIKHHKKHHESEQKTNNDEKDEEIDLKNTWNSIKIFTKRYSTLFLILIPIILSIFLRAMPLYLPITDDWAENTIRTNLRNEIAAQINQQYPNLPQQNKNQLINEQINDYIENNKEQYETAITEASNYFKSRMKDDSGQTYLLAIDPYFWVYFARNILENGHPGTELRNGKPFTEHMYAPRGTTINSEFHMYFDAYFYKVWSFFNPDADIWTSTFYIPIILATLGVIPAFFIAKKRGGNLAGFVAATIVAIHPSFLSRTAGGFADTDSYNVMLPLFIIWFFLEAIESKDLKKATGLVVLSCLTLALFKFAWAGWWFVYLFLLLSIAVYLTYLVASHFHIVRKNIKKFFRIKKVQRSLIIIGQFLVLSLIVVTWGRGFGYLKDILFASPKVIIELKDVATTKIWPNVFTTVAELNPSSIPQTINNIGGKLLFLLSLTGISLTLCSFLKKDVSKEQRKRDIIYISASTVFYIFLIERVMNGMRDITFLILMMLPILIKGILILRNKTKNIDIRYASILIIWFAGTIFGSTRGVRFIMLLMPAFAIAIGLFAGITYKLITRVTEKQLNLSRFITAPILLVLIYLLVLAPPWQDALVTARNEIPSMNDAWWNGLETIKADSQPDAIITSWWDFGHWFRAIANRGVTFDGASQNTPMAHWVGRSLLEKDENTSLGILRMIDCSWNSAYELLEEEYGGLKAIQILDKILPLQSKEDAREILLEENISEEKITELLSNTHCENPPEGYYITSQDMVGKAGVWGHFGAWDFEKATQYFEINRLDPEEGINHLVENYNKTQSEASTLYYEIKNANPDQWISPWPGYYSGVSGCSRKDNSTHQCKVAVQDGQIQLVFNEETGDTHIQTPDGQVRPNSVSYYNDEGKFTIVEFPGQDPGYSFTMIDNGNTYSTIMLDPLLVGGMFTRLFYHEGKGLNHFDKLYDSVQVTGGRIIIWKINWEGVSEETVLNETYSENENSHEIAENVPEESIVSNISLENLS